MKRIYMKFLIIAGLMLSCLSGYSQDPNFYIFLCFGQSNMEGQGTIENQDKQVDDRFKVMEALNCSNLGRTQGSWYTAVPPLCRCSTGLGPADYFGRTMVENLPENITIGIVHVAVAGCKIELFDKVNYASYAASEQAWMQNIIAEYGGNPYGRLVEIAKLAQKDGVIKGILMHQGESNTGDTQWPTKVKGVYDNLLADLGLAAENVPLLAGEVVGADQNGQCASMNNIIATLPNTIPTAHVVSSYGCTVSSDNLHFNSAGYRMLGERYAQKMLELLPASGAPIVKLTAPLADDVFMTPATVEITATASDEDGTVKKVVFYNGDEQLAEFTSEPYTYNWEGVAAGSYTIKAVAIDNDNNESTVSVDIKVREPQGPYGGGPHAIPGLIECEEYDKGGADVAYYDSSPGTEVDPAPDFRTDEDVDLEVCEDTGGGYNLGWTMAGEWTEYTVAVSASGTYSVAFRVACNGDGRTISLSADGKTIVDKLAIPNTGGWQTWETVTVDDIELSAGEQVLRLTIGDEDYVNLNTITFTAKAVEPVATVNLLKGWNLIGFPHAESADLEKALSSVFSHVLVVKNYEAYWDASDPEIQNTLSKLEYGRGYFVKVDAPCELDWIVR